MQRKGIALFVNFLVLLGIWMLYTSSPRLSELYVGIAVSTVAVGASTVVGASGFASFRPKTSWIGLAFLELWYVAIGAKRLAVNLLRAICRKPSLARFHAIGFDTGGDDPESSARRTLVITYLTLPPDSIVVGIDRKYNELLLHEIQPAPLPLVAKILGAKS